MMQATDNQPALPFRQHTLLGVCEAIGEDFGFNPQILRVALAAMLFWSPAAAFGAYAAIALAVLLARTLYPNPTASSALAAERDLPRSENDDQPIALAAAA